MGASPLAFVLVGPTAVGKTAVAHLLARRLNLPVLSADAMMVYRGLDIGTAKPTAEERRQFSYLGLDLADADQSFTVSEYLSAVAAQVHSLGVDRLIVCGGTGLYVKALLHGLDPAPAGDPVLRAELEHLHASGGLSALENRLREAGGWGTLPEGDQRNPRRLMRAIERIASGPVVVRTWSRETSPPIAGITMARPALGERIRARAAAMMEQGLLEETRAWRDRLGPTAGQAIGYAEAADALDGRCSVTEAVDRIALRTRQYAKRQQTWFRRQETTTWVERTPASTEEELAERVHDLWSAAGTVPLRLPSH